MATASPALVMPMSTSIGCKGRRGKTGKRRRREGWMRVGGGEEKGVREEGERKWKEEGRWIGRRRGER